jgi:2-keto-4-pentenoate hydratase/2-oxohepta-3-ene-1,7-dioic acid hydratase in catechol pathway
LARWESRGAPLLGAPVPRPPKIICTGTNYGDYRQVIGLAKSLVPLIFLKAPSCVVGPGDPVQIPEGYGEVYHEEEFSCVIGKRCKGLAKDRVAEVIFRYTIFDDITRRCLDAERARPALVVFPDTPLNAAS